MAGDKSLLWGYLRAVAHPMVTRASNKANMPDAMCRKWLVEHMQPQPEMIKLTGAALVSHTLLTGAALGSHTLLSIKLTGAALGSHTLLSTLDFKLSGNNSMVAGELPI